MKAIRNIMPILFNLIFIILYSVYAEKELLITLDMDVLQYIDGRIEYNFGVGSVSVIILFAISIITIFWILWNAKHYYEGRVQKYYKWISIAIVLVLDGVWMKYYYDGYLSALPEYIIRPALENLL